MSKVGTVSVDGTKLQAKRQAQRDAGKKPRGPEPTPPSATPDPKAQYNFTDPESGHAKVSLEWTLVCVSYNLKRLFAFKNLAAAA